MCRLASEMISTQRSTARRMPKFSLVGLEVGVRDKIGDTPDVLQDIVEAWLDGMQSHQSTRMLLASMVDLRDP
jgi:hypothetical protein